MVVPRERLKQTTLTANRQKCLYVVWDIGTMFPHLMFCTHDFRNANSKWRCPGAPRGTLRQPCNHQPAWEEHRPTSSSSTTVPGLTPKQT